MSTSISWPAIGGTSYSIPAAGELNWQALSTFLIAIGNKAQSIDNTKLAIRTALTSPVTVATGTDCVIVTKLSVPAAVLVNLPAGITGQAFFIVDGTGDASSNNITIDPNGAETINGSATYVINKDRAGVLIGFNGTSWTILAEYSNIAGGTIPRSSIASGSANQVIINNGSGNLSSEAQLAKSRGGTGADNSSVTFPSSGTIPTLTSTAVFTGKTIDGDDNTVQDLALSTLKTVIADANKAIRRDSTGLVVAGPVTISDTGAQAGLISSNFAEVSAPSTPAANTVVVYAKADGKMYSKDDAGVESALTAATVATPTVTGTVTSFVPVIASAVKTVSSAGYTVLTTDGFLEFEMTTGASNQTWTLPALSANIGRTLLFKKVDNGAGFMIVSRAGSDTIDGATSQTIHIQKGYLLLFGGATEWKVIGVYDEVNATGANISTTGSVTATEITNVSLTPGSWKITAGGTFQLSGATVADQEQEMGISTTTATVGTVPGKDRAQWSQGISTVANKVPYSFSGFVVTLTTTTSYYLNAQAKYSAGTPQFSGWLEAVRVG